jgi:hypothetical protein
MIENGIYLATPMPGAALGYTSKGTESVGVEFVLKESGQRVSWYGYFSEKTTERTIEALRFCGWTGQDLSDLSEIGQDQNVEVNLVIEQEEYEGKVRAKVQWVNRAGGLAMASPLDANQAKSFAQRMKGAVLAFDQKTGPAPKKAQKKNRVDEDVFPPGAGDRPPF